MQVNSIAPLQFQSFKSKKSKKSSDNLGELIKKMNSAPKSILKVSGKYPDIKASLITSSQYEREKNARKILNDSKNIEHDLFCIETRALAILRFINNGFSNWHHKNALNEMKNKHLSNCKINGKFYTLIPEGKNDIVTRLYDGARVVFDENGKILEVRQNDYLMRTEIYYYDEGEERPFLFFDGFKENANEIEVQRAYYIGKSNKLIKNLIIKNGKKSCLEMFDFDKSDKSLILKRYKSKDFQLKRLDAPNKYNYKDSSCNKDFCIVLS